MISKPLNKEYRFIDAKMQPAINQTRFREERLQKY